METIINLLKDKNYHLEKFFQLNEGELLNFTEGNFDNLEVFYQSRETILDLIRCIDRLIEAAAATHSGAEDVSLGQKQEMLNCMNLKNDVVQRILGQDLQILSVIEQEKSGIIKELRQVQAGKKAVGAYKTGGVNNKLDEKA
ncbi:MAG TPA: flagellar protein FliT [Bdellovibrionales bacterium]|nr:flagellar protein FliT [Bdellovibrionales bacterium]